jgi:hypothetical protein
MFALLYPPLRRALATAFANTLSTLHSLKVAGVELALNPGAAQVMAAQSTVVVQDDYERRADNEVRRWRVWEKFQQIVEQTVGPLAQKGTGFRSTIHIKDILQPETLYQLVEYTYVSEPSDARKTRGRRNSIRFGIIGLAWRLKIPLYRDVPDKPDELVQHWGMTWDEAAGLAARGRQSFAVIPLYSEGGPRYASDDPTALIFIDAKKQGLFDHVSIEKLNDDVTKAARCSGLTANLARVTRALA